jgi:hypothetical protein
MHNDRLEVGGAEYKLDLESGAYYYCAIELRAADIKRLTAALAPAAAGPAPSPAAAADPNAGGVVIVVTATVTAGSLTTAYMVCLLHTPLVSYVQRPSPAASLILLWFVLGAGACGVLSRANAQALESARLQFAQRQTANERRHSVCDGRHTHPQLRRCAVSPHVSGL